MANDVLMQPDSATRPPDALADGHELDAFLGKAFEDKPLWTGLYENLRDVNFEYKAGKVPDADYQSMRASLEEEAAAIMAEIARLEQAAGQVV